MTVQKPTASRRVNSKAKQKRALQLRMESYSYQEIADIMGIARSHAHKLVKLATDSLNGECKELAEGVLTTDLLRMDALIKAHWTRATKGGDTDAAAFVLRVIDRRAKMLGLDAPTKSEVKNVFTTM